MLCLATTAAKSALPGAVPTRDDDAIRAGGGPARRLTGVRLLGVSAGEPPAARMTKCSTMFRSRTELDAAQLVQAGHILKGGTANPQRSSIREPLQVQA